MKEISVYYSVTQRGTQYTVGSCAILFASHFVKQAFCTKIQGLMTAVLDFLTHHKAVALPFKYFKMKTFSENWQTTTLAFATQEIPHHFGLSISNSINHRSALHAKFIPRHVTVGAHQVTSTSQPTKITPWHSFLMSMKL